MDHSYKYFENRACRYYPCHEGIEELNCLFCYCPLYQIEHCPGSPAFREKDGRRIKVCTACTFPHRAENYDRVIELVRTELSGRSDPENRRIRVGSRADRLSIAQAGILVRRIEAALPDVRAQIVIPDTTEDEALRRGDADMVVRRMEDLPLELSDDLPLAAFLAREDPGDALVLPEGRAEIDRALPAGVYGLRRELQLKELCPGIRTVPVTDDLATELVRLDGGQYSCLVAAASDLKRLGLGGRISRSFSPDEMTPAPCQGVLGVQAGTGGFEDVLAAVNDRDAMLRSIAERAYMKKLGAESGAPDSAYAFIENGVMHLTGMRYDAGTGRIIRDNISGSPDYAELLGYSLVCS